MTVLEWWVEYLLCLGVKRDAGDKDYAFPYNHWNGSEVHSIYLNQLVPSIVSFYLYRTDSIVD